MPTRHPYDPPRISVPLSSNAIAALRRYARRNNQGTHLALSNLLDRSLERLGLEACDFNANGADLRNLTRLGDSSEKALPQILAELIEAELSSE